MIGINVTAANGLQHQLWVGVPFDQHLMVRKVCLSARACTITKRLMVANMSLPCSACIRRFRLRHITLQSNLPHASRGLRSMHSNLDDKPYTCVVTKAPDACWCV